MEKSRSNSAFTKDQEIFIVEEFARNPSPKAVKNAFTKKYRDELGTFVLSKIKPKAFSRVNDRFKKNGIAPANAQSKPWNKGDDCTEEEKVEKIENHFTQYPGDSISIASRNLQIPEETIRRILKKKIRMKPYKPAILQSLTEAHKTQRLEFCRWILEQDEEIIHSIIWSDEKWFHLSQHPNKQNFRYWSINNPYFFLDSKTQGGAKIMAFVLVVCGVVLPVIWHVDEEGNPVSVNSANYRKVIHEQVVPCLPQELLDDGQLWWMQDGATAHTASASMNFLKEIFGTKIISRTASKFGGIEWPAHSPDLNPLDFSFWSQAQSEVYEHHPTTIEEIVAIVEGFFGNLNEEKVKKTVANVLKRAQLCVEEKGGHFEHKL